MLGGKGREARSQLIDDLHKRISAHAEQVYWEREDLKTVIMMDHKVGCCTWSFQEQCSSG